MHSKRKPFPAGRRRSLHAKTLSFLALLSALSVVLARFVSIAPAVTVRFSLEAIPIIISGYLFGPACGAVVGFTADSVGCLFSAYGYNPLFSLPPVLIGLSSGWFKAYVLQKPGFLRILASISPAMLIGSVLWQSWWLHYVYGRSSFAALLASRGIQFAVTAVVDAAILRLLFRSGVFKQTRGPDAVAKPSS